MVPPINKSIIKKLPIGIQDFPYLREYGFHYVDKTNFVYQLADSGKSYFLSRPRRFGKSLFLSTLKAYFEGRQDLFEGLAITELEKDWIKYPVLRLDLNAAQYDSVKGLESIINRYLTDWESEYGVSGEEHLSDRFARVIQAAHRKTGHPAVVLIDEYDKPLLATIGQDELNQEMKRVLKPFYGVLKSMDEHLRFSFITGVTKFGQVSVFSDLNQLSDISLSSGYASLCGITEDELEEDFIPEIQVIADKYSWTYDEALAAIRKKYNGYHFHQDGPSVYNPFSTLIALLEKELMGYWFQTGTPTFLMELLLESDYDLRNLEGVKLQADQFVNYRAEADRPLPVIYQSGYLTIKDYDPRFNEYTLGYPNDEVKYGFLSFISKAYTPIANGPSGMYLVDFAKDVIAGRPEEFINRLRIFFKGIPYELSNENERHYQVILYLIFRLAGQHVESEVRFADGRADAVVKCDDFIYVFEFKYNQSAEAAMKQINEKGYADAFASDSRKVYKIGMNFSPETRNIEDVLIEAVG